MAHNCRYGSDAAVGIGWPDTVLPRGQRSRVERCHPVGHRLMSSSRFASGTGPPLVLTRSVTMQRPTVGG
jgi:hypothetical protein